MATKGSNRQWSAIGRRPDGARLHGNEEKQNPARAEAENQRTDRSLYRRRRRARAHVCHASGDAIGASTGRAFDWAPVGISTRKIPTCARCGETQDCEDVRRDTVVRGLRGSGGEGVEAEAG